MENRTGASRGYRCGENEGVLEGVVEGGGRAQCLIAWAPELAFSNHFLVL